MQQRRQLLLGGNAGLGCTPDTVQEHLKKQGRLSRYLHAGGLRTHVQRCQMQLQRGPSVMQLVISIHAAAATAVSVANSLHHRRDCLLLLCI